MAAPVTAILAHDTKFYDLLPRLFPHADAKAWFVGNEVFANDTADKNGTLQVAYYILALRAVGLDTGLMSGFDNASVNAEFSPGGQIKSNQIKSNVLVNIGYGDPASCSRATRDWNFPRSRRTSERLRPRATAS
jgi:3-hydroxypropanoate dehydrogenase